MERKTVAKAKHRKPEYETTPGALVLDRHALREQGLELRDTPNGVELLPAGLFNTEAHEAGRAFAAAMGLDAADEERMFEAVHDIAMFAALRRAVS